MGSDLWRRGGRIDDGAPEPSLVVFTNYECPYCRVGEGFVKELTEAFPDVGVVVRPVASPSSFPQSLAAAIAAVCSGEQGRFVFMHRQLFASTEWRIDGNFRREAERAGVRDLAEFSLCTQRQDMMQQVVGNRTMGMELGLPGTPGYVFSTGVVRSGLSLNELMNELGL